MQRLQFRRISLHWPLEHLGASTRWDLRSIGGHLAGRRAALLAVLLILAFAFQGSRPLFDPDEGRYVGVALNMIDSGNFLIPQLNEHQPHYAKPPLTYWLIAGSMTLFGRNEWAARLPHALAFIGTGLLLAFIGLRTGQVYPLRAAWMWALMLLPFVAGNIVTTDTVLVLFMTMGIALFVAAETANRSRDARARRTAAWAAFGLAFLTKGPPALLPLIAFSLSPNIRTGERRWLHHATPWGLAAFLLLGFGWFAWVTVREPHLVQYFFEYEFMDRLFTDVHDRNPGLGGALYTFLPVILIGSLPWSIALCTPLFARATPASRTLTSPLSRFSVMWMVTSLIVFVLAGSHLELYLLPLAVPFAIWMSEHSKAVQSLSGLRGAALMVGWLIVLLALKGLGAHLQINGDGRRLGDALRQASLGEKSHWVFVDTAARYSLRFYTGLPVERASLAPEPTQRAWPAPQRDVCRVVAESASPVFLTTPRQAAALRQTLQRCGTGVVTHNALIGGYAVITPRLSD